MMERLILTLKAVAVMILIALLVVMDKLQVKFGERSRTVI